MRIFYYHFEKILKMIINLRQIVLMVTAVDLIFFLKEFGVNADISEHTAFFLLFFYVGE